MILKLNIKIIICINFIFINILKYSIKLSDLICHNKTKRNKRRNKLQLEMNKKINTRPKEFQIFKKMS